MQTIQKLMGHHDWEARGWRQTGSRWEAIVRSNPLLEHDVCALIKLSGVHRSDFERVKGAA